LHGISKGVLFLRGVLVDILGDFEELRKSVRALVLHWQVRRSLRLLWRRSKGTLVDADLLLVGGKLVKLTP